MRQSQYKYDEGERDRNKFSLQFVVVVYAGVVGVVCVFIDGIAIV